MLQLRRLIENLNKQTKVYRELNALMEKSGKKRGKSPEEIMEILRNSHISIESAGRLADERRDIEQALAGDLDMDNFDRKSIEGMVPEALLESFDEAVSGLEKMIRETMDWQQGMIEEAKEKKNQIGTRLTETSIGKNKAKTYYVKDRDACFIDTKSK